MISEKWNTLTYDESISAEKSFLDEVPIFIGRNPVILDILNKVRLVANSAASVLITGESGTGKEIISKLIHHTGEKRHRPFIAINCAALPKDVVDNELFGHEKEAFTGAVSKKSGCFELAHGGTLFLDEIVEMHPQTQAKLLRAIENKSFRRLGGREEVCVETRVVAATNRDIPTALKEGLLREDLFYRLSVVEFVLPPLRERKEDIPLLVEHFMDRLAQRYKQQPKQFSKDSMDLLIAYDWPGNIRELRNMIERMILVCPDETITHRYFPDKICREKAVSHSVIVPVGVSLAESERILIHRTLESVQNNKSAAARVLGISRRTLHSKLKGRG
jgi:transcriptional regulator with PAS, ATPase and Fis domain